MDDVYLFDALRTPRGLGKPAGALAGCMPHELVGQLVSVLHERHHDGLGEGIGGLVLGCVGQVADQGGHIALVSRMHAGLPDTCRALSINNYCVSGLSAVGVAALDAAGRADEKLRLAGGVEMMSRVPFSADKAALYTDAATSKALNYVPVYLAADLVATLNGITRAELDVTTERSHRRAATASKVARDEMIAVRDEKGEILLETDQSVRPGLSIKSLSRFQPAFEAEGGGEFRERLLTAVPDLDRIEHVHTVAHCPPVADGAALALLGSKKAGEAAGIAPRARLLALEEATASPALQLTAGFAAMDRVLDRTGLTLSDFDQIEFMEAFAATPAIFERSYGPDLERVNPEGGHLAMGHPMGATGAILLSALLGGLKRRDGELGLVVAHGGSGVGAAAIVQRV